LRRAISERRRQIENLKSEIENPLWSNHAKSKTSSLKIASRQTAGT
jgi:hypothetical protein